MKLKLKNSEIYVNNGVTEHGLLMALVELEGMKMLPTRVQYNCYKSLQECKKEAQVLEDSKKKVLTESCAKDEKGEPVIVDGQYTYETPEIKQEVIKKMNELYDMEVEVEILQLPIAEAFAIKEMPGGLLGKLIGKFFVE